jgi:hypothetical protein
MPWNTFAGKNGRVRLDKWSVITRADTNVREDGVPDRYPERSGGAKTFKW